MEDPYDRQGTKSLYEDLAWCILDLLSLTSIGYGIGFEICFRVLLRLLFQARKWWLEARNEVYWYDYTDALPRHKLIVHLQDEIAAAQLSGTTESM
jgi:hypothetical protein